MTRTICYDCVHFSDNIQTHCKTCVNNYSFTNKFTPKKKEEITKEENAEVQTFIINQRGIL